MTRRQDRLRGRGTESDEQIALRLGNAQGELAVAPHYDYILPNALVEVQGFGKNGLKIKFEKQ